MTFEKRGNILFSSSLSTAGEKKEKAATLGDMAA